jgi:acetyl esterase/lipase
MSTGVNFSNQSLLSYYCSPSVGNIVDWATGRDYLETNLASLVNGAVAADPQEMSRLREKLFNNQHVKRVKVPSQNGLTLDGVLFKSEQPTKGVIFFALGSGGYYEKIADPQDPASRFVDFFRSSVGKDIDVLAVNYGRVGESRGTPSYEEWVLDIRAGIQYLLNAGYDSQHLLVYGHSLGAWLAVDAVKDLSDNGVKIPIASDRSFSNLSDEIFHYFGGKAKGYSAYACATYAKWNANIEKNWESLDKSLVIYSPSDCTVPYVASLFGGLQSKGYFKNPASDDEGCFVFRGGTDVHTRAFTEEEKLLLGPRLRKMMSL